MGLHRRISNIPAENISVYSDWEDDEYIMKTSGEVRECIDVKYNDDVITVGIENNKIGVHLTYSTDVLKVFLIWKMPGESDYVVGLEPCTTSCGGVEIENNNKYILLEPFKHIKTNLKFKFYEKDM